MEKTYKFHRLCGKAICKNYLYEIFGMPQLPTYTYTITKLVYSIL